MTAIQKRLVSAWATLVMAGRKTIEDVPETAWTLSDGTQTTLRAEVEIEIANREIAALS
jgi:hypothetical protein